MTVGCICERCGADLPYDGPHVNGSDGYTHTTERGCIESLRARLGAARAKEHAARAERDDARDAAMRAVGALDNIGRWRADCHEHDVDMGAPRRPFLDDEEWQIVEEYARTRALDATAAMADHLARSATEPTS